VGSALSRACGAHDLLACICDWIVALVRRHLNALVTLSRQNIVASVVFIIDVLCTNQGANSAVFVILSELLAVAGAVVLEI